MSDDDETKVFDGRVAHQFGEDFKEPGEPYSVTTLDTIRTLVSEDVAVSVVPADAREKSAVTKQHGGPSQAAESPQDVSILAAESFAVSPPYYFPDYDPPEDQLFEGDVVESESWRRLHVIEGAPGRILRHFVFSPRLLALALLSGVVIWQPWFIPSLVLVIVCTFLLLGTLIGQDRMARFALFLLKRFVWCDPNLGRSLQKVLPQRWHPVLYRPLMEEDAWEGPIDPSFAARLLRLQTLKL